MFLSVFDLFKIGIGPSSSHTMGPMSAGLRFLDELQSGLRPRPSGTRIAALRVSLHGSLAFTGIGHGSDRAVILGLAGFSPQTVDPDRIDAIVAAVMADKQVEPDGHPAYRFDPARDLVLDKANPLPLHANGMTFSAYDGDGAFVQRAIYYSIGGGFVLSEEELQEARSGRVARDGVDVPHPFNRASDLLAMCSQTGKSIAALQRANELVLRDPVTLDRELDALWETMNACVERGLSQDGVMPGGLNVRRRARALHTELEADARRNVHNPLHVTDWLSVFAMAVNEENAGGGRVVTAPTNGAAGVIPAVLRYWRQFHAESEPRDHRAFLLTAAAIGGLIKRNASISGAEVGCQGEVGSASAMAAAGLAALMGGTPNQIENAAEIALEHHLGMTCDPVKGLVQVPCIERNAFGAVKAVTAASLALRGDGAHFVPLDAAIETMRQTGQDMSEKYKETSLGGLAVNTVEC
ncbi:MAG: L-serine ammonia-lyase [Devosia sp.]|uniref:L-serine ammonia-lyase n=1 Tax=Devosia sp. TaxID=1871048 RepID=UPI0024C88BAD|nr:L-serine ammonia-lyase [Devosia sp.]UYN98926.1 MAG: L-serine ammonia-lyase [Devosia sp.]